jgi:hypothetical protein
MFFFAKILRFLDLTRSSPLSEPSPKLRLPRALSMKNLPGIPKANRTDLEPRSVQFRRLALTKQRWSRRFALLSDVFAQRRRGIGERHVLVLTDDEVGIIAILLVLAVANQLLRDRGLFVSGTTNGSPPAPSRTHAFANKGFHIFKARSGRAGDAVKSVLISCDNGTTERDELTIHLHHMALREGMITSLLKTQSFKVLDSDWPSTSGNPVGQKQWEGSPSKMESSAMRVPLSDSCGPSRQRRNCVIISEPTDLNAKKEREGSDVIVIILHNAGCDRLSTGRRYRWVSKLSGGTAQTVLFSS